MKRPVRHKNFSYEKTAKHLRKLLSNIVDISENDIKYQPDGIPYKGQDIESSSILACSADIKTSFSKQDIAYHKERGRDLIDIFINKVFQLGYSVGYEKRYEETEFHMSLLVNLLKEKV